MAPRWTRLGLGAVLAILVVAIVIFLAARKPSVGPVRLVESASTAPGLAKAAAAASLHVSGEWRLPAGDYASTRYSDLAEITTQNVGKLKPAFTFDTGFLKGHEAAPLVVGSTMYLVTPYPNVVYALDLTKPSAPVKWRFDPKPDPRSQGVACCDVVSRGMSYDNGRLFMVTLDGQAIDRS